MNISYVNTKNIIIVINKNNEIINKVNDEIDDERKNEIDDEKKNEIDDERKNEIDDERKNEIDNERKNEIDDERKNEIDDERKNERSDNRNIDYDIYEKTKYKENNKKNPIIPQNVVVIKNIFIKGTTKYSIDKISKISNIHKGDYLNIKGKTIYNAIHRLWNSNLFKNISLYKENIHNNKKNKNEINIYFELEDRICFDKILIKGVTKDLEKHQFSCIKNNNHSDMISDDFIQKIKNEIIDFYIKQGYLKVSISANIEYQKKNNFLVLDVFLGNKIFLSKILFNGNKIFSDKELDKIMKQNNNNNNNNNYLYYFYNKNIDLDYNKGIENIISKYQSCGFRDIQITFNKIIKNDQKNYEVIVNISEGKKYYIGNINFVGNTVYSTKYLKEILNYNNGDIYNKQKLENLIFNQNISNSIIYNYLNLGYFSIKIFISETKVINDKIYLEIKIKENHPLYIKSIHIDGNTITSNHIITRELKHHIGDRISIKKIYEDLNRLQSLDLFKLVYPKIIYHNHDLVDLTWQVIENNHNYFKFMIGSDNIKNCLGSFNIYLKNISIKKLFNIKQWNPFPNPQGDGQKLLLYNKLGTNYQHYGMSFIEPRIGDNNNISYFVKINCLNKIIKNSCDPDLLLFNEIYHDNNYNITDNNKLLNNKRQYSIGLSTPITLLNDPYYKLDFGINYDRYIYHSNNIIKHPLYLNNLYYLIALKKFSKESNNIFPLSGSQIEINGIFTLPYSKIFNDEHTKNSWLEYFKIKSLFYWYKQICTNLVFKTGCEFGILGKYNDNKDLFAFQKFYMGGRHKNIYGIFYPYNFIPLRGYSLQNFNNPGGFLYDKYLLEMRYLMFNNIKNNKLWANVFLEGVNIILPNSNKFSINNMKNSIGLGFRCSYIPLGIFGIDLGYPLFKDENNNTKWKIHFIIENNNN
ncbi:POTRA domain-containing protein [Blattabacterium cuenoti]|uniref:POTRA domain-containing protein n=1 Tax=Blattabacterium cuenoti TaxID=1653831 RepID=UPI00163C5F8A|nr:POTRA domain-containing protein [Blattabacterium cuenoti]